MSGITRLGRYEIEKELGRGAMAVVYKALDPLIGRVVAVKTIRMEGGTGMEQEQLRQRLYREAQSAGNLNHPNIVTIYDIGQEGELSYIAMEYVDGQTLEDWIAQNPAPALERTLSIVEQIAAGLDFAAVRGITHRDVKPGNILLDSDLRVKIADFGIAKLSMSKMTQTGLVMGTPSYMSPEQAMGRELDGRSDLFSLGIIFYEMLTGERPFSGTNPTTIIYKILHEEPVPPGALNVTLHPGLDYIVRRMLAKDPAERYQSSGEFIADLKNYRSLGAPSKSKEKPAGKPGRLATIAAGVVILLAAASYLGYMQMQKPVPAGEPPAVSEPVPAAPPLNSGAGTPGPTASPVPSADAAAPGQATLPAAEPAPPKIPEPARVSLVYAGEPYGVGLFEGRRKIRDVSAASTLEVPAGEHSFRLVNQEVFLNRQLPKLALEPAQDHTITLPGLGSAYIELPNDAYEGCEILLDGVQLPTPYPAQIPKLSAGEHRLVFRWVAGKDAGEGFTATFSIEMSHHYLVMGDPDTQSITVQRAR